ncbi:MAG: translation initiation factor IF-2 subunit beta [Candidatus Aenigmarchaeota archaeon]|nr:translation initiation factor IF-2 subunit beta [Candidatus Aenigmarchaeota archaeon]
MKSYEEMLKEAYERIPERVKAESRLEIPKPVVFFQGNKTIIDNFKAIVDTVRRDPKHMAKYLFKELATPGNVDGKRLILLTRLTKEAIEKKINMYVEEYVICKECKKPDTKLIKEGRITFLKCEACGAKYPVRKV